MGASLFHIKETIELPRALQVELSRPDYEYHVMGLFPSIHHLWVALDSNLFLFDYSGTIGLLNVLR